VPQLENPATNRKLVDLLDYVEQVVRLDEHVAMRLADYRLPDKTTFALLEAELRNLPGIRHNNSDGEGSIWLQVERLTRQPPPRESSMSRAGLDNRHRNKDGEISGKHGNTLIRTLRKVYGQNFAAGYPETEKLSEVLLQLNETSLSQLRRDHETGHLEHKIANASK
jgi:hypothetical protein